MRTVLSSISLCSAALVLYACGGDATAPDGDGARGDVLEGSINDDMIPLDTVRSQPPLADRSEIDEVGESGEADEGDEAGQNE